MKRPRFLYHVAIAFIFLVSSNFVVGATKTANTTGNWNVDATWSGAAAPISDGGDDLVINTGVTVTLTGDYTTTGSLTINGTGRIELNGYKLTVGVLTATGSAVINNSGASKTLTVGNGSASSYTGVVSGLIALVKNGAGALTLSGANTYSGGTTLSAGTLNINNASAIGTGTFTISGASTIDNTSSGAIILSTDNLLSFNADFTFTGTQNLNLGNGMITLLANRIITVTAKELGINGGIDHSSLNLTKAGNGTLTLDKQTLTLNNLTISAGTLNAGSSLIRLYGAISNSGTFTPATGTVSFSGTNAQTIPSFTFYGLAINNTNASGVELSGAVSVTGALVLNNGKVTIPAANIITVQSTASISGGSTLSYINGPIKRVLPANLSSSANIYLFPVGTSSAYYPFYITNATTGATGPTISVQAFAAAISGTTDGTLSSLSNTEYWNASITAGTYTNGSVSLGKATLGTLNAIARSATNSGATYTSLQGTASGSFVINSSLTGNSLGYFVLGSRMNYYSKSSGNLNDLSSWTPNADGSAGTAPASFSLANTVWNIRYNANPTTSADWAVSGTGSYINLGDGTNACNFTLISSQTSTLPTINIADKGTLILNSTVIPKLGVLSSGSTVAYASGSAQTVSAANYYNLNLTGGNRTLSTTGSIGVAGTLTVGAGTITTYGSTVIFNSTTNQTIPVISGGYYNLQSQLGGTKTFANNIRINGVLTIGNISKIDAEAKTVTFDRDASETKTGFNRIKATGTFIPSSSTVIYSTANDTVSSVNYFNLTLSGSGKFATTDLIGIAGSLTGTSSNWTKTGSTVVFNGTTAQNMPNTAFSFGNLKINNANGVTLQSNVTVAEVLTLLSGVLYTTSSYSIAVTNTDVNAVLGGGASTYVDGKLTRSLPTNLTASANTYAFPVGNYASSAHHYLPLVLSSITTGASAPTYSVQAYYASSGGSAGGAGATQLTSINPQLEYWQTSYTGNFTSTKLSLTRPTPLSGVNAIGYSSTKTGAYISEHGTVNGSYSVINSDVVTGTGADYYVLGTRNTSAATYYYTATGAGCATPALNNTACWWTGSDGTGTNPSNFSSNDVTYYVKASATMSNYDWTVTGYGTSIYVGNGSATTLTVGSGHSISTTGDLKFSCSSTLTIQPSAIVSVAGTFSMPTSLNCGSGPITVNNYGTFNIAQGLSLLADNSYATINNYSSGVINLVGDYVMKEYTSFINYGTFNISNGNLVVKQMKTGWSFTNANNAVVNVDNSNSVDKGVYFGANKTINTLFGSISDNPQLVYSNDVKLQTGSRFNIVKSELMFNGSGDFSLGGIIYLQDGNATIVSGANFNITTPGGMYLSDNDNSGDGILKYGVNGGISLNDSGTLYAEGVYPVNGGGNMITVASGANMFVGNIGLYTGSNSNYLKVLAGGVLNFCGNKTAGADNVGKIEAGGTLNYALGYYTTQTPGAQSDFVVEGSQVAAFADAASCLAAFENNMSGFLPITLSYFGVKPDGDAVAIEWITSSEVNNDFFSIYKSFDALTFTEIAEVKGAGNSTQKKYYKVYDEEPLIGINYYKLKQTDFDGHASFSPIRSIKYNMKNVDFEVYPNPSKFENITVVINVKRTEDLSLVITDLKGRTVFETKLNVEKGQRRILLIDYMYLNSGTYNMSIIRNQFFESKKFVVK